MGTVYLARDIRLARDVAVKVLHPRYEAGGPAAIRFLSEARVTAQLQHPGVPPVHQVEALSDGRPFLVMKMIKGRTLNDELADATADRGRLLAAFEQVCQAVAYAHDHKVIHRDLKPQNVMVGAFGEVQVMDWGLAKVLARTAGPGESTACDEATVIVPGIAADRWSGDATQTGSVLGTPAYMPPEQAIGAVDQIDARSDVFGLGAILCAILTGKPPYLGADFEATRQLSAWAKLGDAFGRLDASEADPGWVELCKRCLAAEKADRPADADEVARAVAGLRAAADERARAAEMDLVRAEGERAKAELEAGEQRKRRRAHVAAVAALALLLAGGGAFAWYSDRQVAARERDERTRQARTAEAVAALLNQCEADLRTDRVDQASVSLEAAERRAADGGADELAGWLAECRAGLELYRALEDIDALSRTTSGGKYPGRPALSARWRAAIAAYGIPPDEPPSAESVARVNGSPVRERLLMALDTWRANDKSAWLRAFLRAVDPDPYRDAIRDAIAAENAKEVRTLAWHAKALEQPPRFAVVLGRDYAISPERRRAVLTNALRAYPGNREVLFSLGNSYPNSGPGLDAQIRWFQAAVTAHPKFTLAHTYLGNALMNKSDPEGAAASFRVALMLDPTYGTHHSNLGRALFRIGNLSGALDCFQDAVLLDPDHFLAHQLLAWLLAAGPDGMRNGKLAVEHATRACELTNWKSAGMIDTLAAAHAEAGNFDKAVHLQKQVLANPRLDKADVQDSQERLRLYEQRKPYRDPELARELAPPPRVVK
ncbi:MAG TPA: protein kinase [Gemmataceae bacterium]|nr:protein kinase [Gemmataceae bacterium]